MHDALLIIVEKRLNPWNAVRSHLLFRRIIDGFASFVVFKSATFTMQHLTKGIIYGPLWISVGERFRPNGAYAYLQCRYQEYVSHLQKLKKAHSEVLTVMEDKMKKKHKGKRSDEDSDDSSNEDSKKKKDGISNKALLSMKRNEIMEHREVSEEIHRWIETRVRLWII